MKSVSKSISKTKIFLHSGEKGATGLKGHARPTLTLGDKGANSPKGSKGIKGSKGTQMDPSASTTGPKGIKGLKDVKGHGPNGNITFILGWD